MRRLLIAAVLALLIHGIIFSLRSGWLTHEPAKTSKFPAISIDLQPFQQPEADTLQHESENHVQQKKAVEPIVSEVSQQQNPPQEEMLLLEPEQKKTIESSQKKKAVPIEPALSEAPVERQKRFDTVETDVNPSVDRTSGQSSLQKNLSNADKEHDDNENQNEVYSNSQFIIKATPLYKLIPKPRYPRLARTRGYQGTVHLNVLVGDDGMVKDLQVASSSGHPILDRSALESVRKWIFEPGKKGTTKIAMWVSVPVTFLINE